MPPNAIRADLTDRGLANLVGLIKRAASAASLRLMYAIPRTAVVQWGSTNGRHVPTVIDLLCPACKRPVTFHLPNWSNEEAAGSPKGARCPACGRVSDLLRLGGGVNNEVRIYLDATDPSVREPVAGLDLVSEDSISLPLKKAYQSALNVFAIGEAEATAASCRRVVEGIMERIGSEPHGGRRRVLAQRIRDLADNPQVLARPIIELSEALRERGNLAAHFNADIETSIDDAGRMLDLLDYLITYLFVVPEQIHRFKAREDASSETDDVATSAPEQP
jgi:hypothetical protein